MCIAMDEFTASEKNPAAVELGRLGGRARAITLKPARRKAIAIKASKAAAKLRRAKARQKKGSKA